MDELHSACYERLICLRWLLVFKDALGLLSATERLSCWGLFVWFLITSLYWHKKPFLDDSDPEDEYNCGSNWS